MMTDNTADVTGASGVHRRSDHERDNRSSFTGKGAAVGGLAGSGLFKLAQTCKVPPNYGCSSCYVLLTRIVR